MADGYEYFKRTHKLDEFDPLVQKIRSRYADTHDGKFAPDGAVRHILWRLLFERKRFPTFDAAVSDWVKAQDVEAIRQDTGLRHPWQKARAAWLYPGNREFWLASQRMMTWSEQKLAQYLNLPEIKDHSTHVIVNCSTGHRPYMRERKFSALKSPKRVERVLTQIIEADKSPICFLMSQEYFIQVLDASHRRLLDELEHVASLVQSIGCAFVIPFRELGEIYSGKHDGLQRRTEMVQAMRKGCELPIAIHERGLVEVPVSDFNSTDGDCISLLQTSFRCPTGGKNRPEDRVTNPSGHHEYDGACGFIRSNYERMRDWQEKGRMERHTNAVGEHSIPHVFQGQPWLPTRVFGSAQRRGKKLLKAGAAFDLSGAATKE